MTDLPIDPDKQPSDAEPVPTAEWIPWPKSDSADWLDRPAPTYMEDEDAAS
jgi:hypothetical protein